MKFYLFISLLLLFSQLINCDGEDKNEDVTISGLMETLYEKANEKQIELKAHLYFIDNPFGETYYEACAECTGDFAEFEFKIDEIAEKVPRTMVLEGKNARNLLFRHMESILRQERARPQLNQEIKTEFNFNTLDKNDKMFYDSYKQWLENSVDRKHMKYIDSKIDYHIIPVYVKLIGEIINNLNDAKLERSSINASINSINTMYHSLYFEGTNEDVEHLIRAVIELSKSYKKLVESLTKLKNTTKELNNQRVLWVEFFIGLRKQLGADRTPVEPFTKISKVQRIAKATYDVGAEKLGSCTCDNVKDTTTDCAKGCAKGSVKVMGAACTKGCIAFGKRGFK